jgi:subfamily B ATP-binding cassette protein MsbA
MREFLRKFISPNLARLLSYLSVYRWTIAGALFFMLTAATTSSLIAVLFGKLTQIGFYDQQPWIVIAAPIGLIFVACLNGGSMFMSNFLLAKVSQSLLFQLRGELFSKILQWPEHAYQRNLTGIIASKFVNEANVALSNAAKSSIILVRDSLQVVGLICVLVWHDIALTLVTLVIAPAIVWLLKYISAKLRSILAGAQQNVATLLVRIKESYDARQIIKVSNTFESEIQRFKTVNDEVRSLALNMTKVSSAATPATQFIGVCGVAVVLVVAMIESQRGLLTLGEFITFLTAMMLILPPLRRLTGINSALVGISVAADSIFSTLDEPVEVDNGTVELSGVRKGIVFEHVCLRYPGADRDAVHDFSLHASAGDTIALVGLSGSGKSSLVNLLPRFWNPSAGRILIDGNDYQTVTLASLRQQIAIVSQDVILFDGTIRDNIAYGCPNATPQQIEAAIESASLTEFVSSLPNGLDTPVGEAGSRLSGGQKQRISIARALLKDAPILILDEATSALDAENEHRIKMALARLMKGRTTFIVAHRLSTIEYATKIVAMQAGEIAEVGTHAELLQKNGVYAHLCKLQGIGNLENHEQTSSNLGVSHAV